MLIKQRTSLQCRPFAYLHIGLGKVGREGVGKNGFFLPLPLPRYFSFQPTCNFHFLGRILASLQTFSEFNPRWRSLDQNVLARDLASQNTPALQASKELKGFTECLTWFFNSL